MTPEFTDVPPEIILAAQTIDVWMKQNGHTSYELMNICSRNHAYRLRELKDQLKALTENPICIKQKGQQ